MFRVDPVRWLEAALVAALAAVSQVSLAQGSAPTTDQSSEQAPVQTPAAALVPTPATPSARNPAPPATAPAGNASQAPATASTHPDQSQPSITAEDIGDALMAHQRYQAAIAAYAKDPYPSAHIWNKMGIAYQMMFSPSSAARCYKASLHLNPNDARVVNNLATIYDSLKQYRQAERLYRKALRIDPQSAVVLKNLGTNLMAQHKFDKGREAYKQALEIDPNIFADRSSPRVQNATPVKDRGAINYYMAVSCASAGLADCAIEYLRMALDEGYITAQKLEQDKDFSGLHGNPSFQRLLTLQKMPP